MKTQLQLLITMLIFFPLSLFSRCWQSVYGGETHIIALKDDGTLKN